jgi:hypothetical protein
MKQLIEFSQEVVDRFLRSKGWDPRHIDRNRRMAFTKTKEFQMFASRMSEQTVEEQASGSHNMVNKPYTKGLAQTRAHTKDMALKRSVHVNKPQLAVNTEAMEFPGDDGMNPQGSSSKVAGESYGNTNKKREMSKSARIIKSLYKNKRMQKEELYDHEKDKKGPGTNVKKAKLTVGEKQMGDNKTDAAAILSGGTTLTGQKRDTVMIDPVLKKAKPGAQNSLTDNNDK